MRTTDDSQSSRPSIPLLEFQHYVRNMLAIIRSLVRRTAQGASSVDDMSAALEGRIGALGRAQSHLASDPMRGADLETILRDELLAYRLHVDDRIVLDGPKVSLSWRAAMTLTLAMHELLTNAIRHGALIDGGGRLSIGWTLNDDRRIVRLRWCEDFDPRPIGLSSGGGLGWEFLENTLAYELDADVMLALDARSFRCEVAFPLPA